MSNITLVRPPSVFAKFAVALNATPPISLAYIAGSLARAGHQVNLIDGVGEALEQVYESHLKPLLVNGLTLEQILARTPKETEFIGISCLFTHEWPNIQKMARLFREAFPKACLIIGGEHATAVPEYSLQSAPEIDVAVLGEGEETILEVVRAWKEGTPLASIPGIAYREGNDILRTPRRARISEIDAIAEPRWDLVPLESYLSSGSSFGVDLGRSIPMLATRGCPFKCTFCSSLTMWTQKYETRSPRLVVEEIERYIQTYRVRNIDFYDLTAVVNRGWIIEFCKLLIEKNLQITWQLPSGTRSEAIDEEVSRYLYLSGCRNLTYAPESGSPRVLKRIKKMVIPDRMIESMRASIKNKLNVKANIIFGFPEERLSDILKSLWFMWRMAWIGVVDVSIWAYSPYPGCELFDMLKQRGRIKDFNDEYFVSLLAYSDFTSDVSYDDYLSPRMIKYLRVFGMASFYGLRYAANPLRLVQSIYRIVSGHYVSRMEMAVGSNLRRFIRMNPRRKESPDCLVDKKAA